MSDLDVLAELQGSDTQFRIDAVTIPGLLVRATRSNIELGMEFVFDAASPAQIQRFYEYTRRRIGRFVNVSVSGTSFTGKLVDTTKLPPGYKPENIVNTMFEFVFERVHTRTASSVKRGMISLPVPNRIVKSWACKGLKPDPHITLGYMPNVNDDQAKGIVDIVRDVAKNFKPFDVVTHGQGIFGINSRVALVATNPELRAFRQLVVAKVLRKYPRIVDITTHPVWHPHVTLGSHDRLPMMNTDAMFTLSTVDVNIVDGSVYSVNFAM